MFLLEEQTAVKERWEHVDPRTPLARATVFGQNQRQRHAGRVVAVCAKHVAQNFAPAAAELGQRRATEGALDGHAHQKLAVLNVGNGKNAEAKHAIGSIKLKDGTNYLTFFGLGCLGDTLPTESISLNHSLKAFKD